MIFDNPAAELPFIIIGITLIVLGIFLYRFPPKKINGFYGYRTIRSMKSQQSWDFAQKYSAKELIKFSSLLLIVSITGVLLDFSDTLSILIGLGMTLNIFVIVFVKSEKALKNKFK